MSRLLFFFSVCGCSVVPAPFVEKLFLYNCPRFFLKDQLTIFVQSIYGLSFLFNCYVCLYFIDSPLSCFYSCIVRLEFGECQSSIL